LFISFIIRSFDFCGIEESIAIVLDIAFLKICLSTVDEIEVAFDDGLSQWMPASR
jgi:hypothetical protein